MLKCEDCNYYWQDEWEDYPSCKYPPNDPWPAPCEEDDYEEVVRYDEE